MTSFQFVAGIVVLQVIVYVPITSCRHAEYNLTTNLCNPLKRAYVIPVKLSDEIPVIIVNSHNKFLKWPTMPTDYCDFIIEARDKRNGIFAVIQNISFRNSTGGSCTDSITFMRSDRHKSILCGEYHRRTHMLYQKDSPLKGSRFYSEYSPRESIRTIVEVSSEELRPDFSMGFSIAYTLYKDCNRTDPTRYQRVVSDLNICIPKELFCDGVYNCGGMDYCLDEESCETPVDVISDETGTKVTVAVVTTILQCFVIFIVCLWICRRQKKLCWSADCAGPAAERNTPALSHDIDHRSQSHTVSSAPMLEEVMLNAVQDKDLPPSYDSLFPENANLSNP